MSNNHVIFAGFRQDSQRTPEDSFMLERLTQACRSRGYFLTVVEATTSSTEKFVSIEQGDESILRANVGYDFGSWNHALELIDSTNVSKTLFINSSIVGPINKKLVHFLDKCFSKDSDVNFLTESRQVRPHGQSFCWTVSKRVLHHVEFRQFLAKPLSENTRQCAISEKELMFNEVLRRIGVNPSYSFPAGTLCTYDKNPSIHGWRRLVTTGFPFIKKSVRDSIFTSLDLEWLVEKDLLENESRSLFA